jgi:hypothetical protein
VHDNYRSSEVKFKVGLGQFGLKDFARLSRLTGGLVPKEDIGEIFNATRNNPQLILFLLRAFARNPARILVSYTGKLAELPDYPANPNAPVPLVVSLMSGTVMSKSYGEHRGEGGKNGIFDAVAIMTGLMGKWYFPQVYRRVRKAFDEFKSYPPLSPEQVEEIRLEALRRKKERIFSYVEPFFGLRIRRSPKARTIWKTLPLEVQEEEFGKSPPRFKDFLSALASEDASGELFRVIEHLYSANVTRFQFIGTRKNGKSTS